MFDSYFSSNLFCQFLEICCHLLGSHPEMPDTGFHPVSFSRLPVSLRLDGLMISRTRTFRIGRNRVVKFRPKSCSCGIMPIWRLPRDPAKLENSKFSFDSGPWHLGLLTWVIWVPTKIPCYWTHHLSIFEFGNLADKCRLELGSWTCKITAVP